MILELKISKILDELRYSGGLILGKDFILKKEIFFFWREASLRAFS